jgi:hypothetical protein
MNRYLQRGRPYAIDLPIVDCFGRMVNPACNATYLMSTKDRRSDVVVCVFLELSPVSAKLLSKCFNLEEYSVITRDDDRVYVLRRSFPIQ